MPATASQPPADKTNPTPAKKHRVRLTLVIDDVTYSLRPLAAAELRFGEVRGFHLTRPDRKLGRVRHRIADGIDGPACSCGSQTYRQGPTGGTCKHLGAAAACGLM